MDAKIWFRVVFFVDRGMGTKARGEFEVKYSAEENYRQLLGISQNLLNNK